MLAAILCLLGLAAVELFPPAPYEHVQTAADVPPDPGMNEKAGWYVFDDGGDRLLTWSAKGGLSVNRFDSLAQSRMRPKTGDVYVWALQAGDRDVAFERDAAGNVAGFSWTGADGRPRHAARSADGPYRQEEVGFSSKGARLSGLLFIARSADPGPAVVFIHGSGESDRDMFWYLYQAHYLASNGISVLLPDKRGCGKSGGQWHTASFEDLAGDAAAGLQFLSGVEGVDSSKLGLIGFSQGGWIAPLAARQAPLAGFVVSVSGAAVTPGRQLAHEVKQDMIREGVPGLLASAIEPVFSRRAKKRFPEFWRLNGDFDPLPLWKRARIPLLFIYGEKDEEDNIPVHESVGLLETLDTEGGEVPHIRVYPGSGHALGDPSTGWIRREYLEFLARWINERTGTGGG